MSQLHRLRPQINRSHQNQKSQTYETEKPLEPAPVAPSYENEPTPPVKTPDQPEPSKPEEPNYDPLPTPPVAPTPKQLPTPPAVPTVHFHYNRLFAQPQINKEIKNEDGVDIDRTLVAKQSVVKFELKTEAFNSWSSKNNFICIGRSTSNWLSV